MVKLEVMQIKETSLKSVFYFRPPPSSRVFRRRKGSKQCTLSPDLSHNWLTQKNDNVMILIFHQQEEYNANLSISNGIRKH